MTGVCLIRMPWLPCFVHPSIFVDLLYIYIYLFICERRWAHLSPYLCLQTRSCAAARICISIEALNAGQIVKNIAVRMMAMEMKMKAYMCVIKQTSVFFCFIFPVRLSFSLLPCCFVRGESTFFLKHSRVVFLSIG